MKSGISNVIAILAAGVLALPISANAACNNATLKGKFGVTVFGVNGTAEPFVHVNVARTAIFDGAGNFSGAGWESINGVTAKFSTSGTYEVDANCTVTITGTLSSGEPNTQFGVIVSKGNKIFGVRTVVGTNESLIYERQ